MIFAYFFETGCVKTECLQEGWQTSGSLRIVRMAFNLYCNGTPSVGDYEAEEDQLKECQCYTVEDLIFSIHILPVFVKTILWITDFNGFPKIPGISAAKQIFYGIILTLF